MKKFIVLYSEFAPDTEPVPVGKKTLFDTKEQALEEIERDMQSSIRAYKSAVPDAPDAYIAPSGLFLELNFDHCIYYNILEVEI